MKITDPDSFSIAVNATATTEEVEVQTAAKTVKLRVSGNLDDTAPGKNSGATGKALYSFLVEEWLTNATLRRHRFPIKMIFEGSFIWVNGWGPADQQTRDLLRDAGFLEQTTGRQNACIVSLGPMDDPASDLAYYQQVSGFTASVSNFDKTGELNENLMIHDGGVTDYTNYVKLFLRVQGKKYAEYNLIDEQGLAALTYQAYRLPLANETDLDVTDSDNTIDTTLPYTGMKVNYLKGAGFTTWATATVYPAGSVVKTSGGRWFFTAAGGTSSGTDANLAGGSDTGVVWETYDGEEQIGSTYYAGNRIITCNGGTAKQVHEWAQRQLRKTTNVNADDTSSVNQRGFGNVNGNVAKYLTLFVGPNLKPAPGVILRGFDTNSTNNIQHSPIGVDGGGLTSEFIPMTYTEVAFPFVSAGTLNFSSNSVDAPDADTIYSMYFDYVTTTAGTDISVSDATGSTATIGWTGATLDHLTSGDWLSVTGATNAGNNGIWEITGAVDTSLNTAACTKRDGLTPVDETAGAAITVRENPFNTPGAILVNDNSGTPIEGQITAASIAWDFDYTNNNQGGRTPNTNAAVRVVALAKGAAEWGEASHTITAATGQSIAVNLNDERNYANPA